MSALWHFRIATRASAAERLPADLDLNGDGFADVALAWPMADGGSVRVLIAYGAAAGLGTKQTVVLSPPPGAIGFGATGSALISGSAIAAIGDVNGDGYGDLAVGAPYAGERPSACGRGMDPDLTGRVYVYFGSELGISPHPTSTLIGTEPGDKFGTWISGGGDVDGDGYADLLVGSAGGIPPLLSCRQEHESPPPPTKNRISLFHGGPAGPSHRPLKTFTPDGWAAGVGYSFRGGEIVGDVDGDGFSDVLITAEEGGSSRGAEWRVHFGANGGIGGGLSATLTGDIRADGLARGLAIHRETAIDVVLVPGQGRGPALSYGNLSKGARLGGARSLLMDGLASRRLFAADDFDADGFSDMVVAVPAEKRALVFPGAAEGLRSRPLPIEPHDQPLRFATSLHVGDFDGDGFGDVTLAGYQPGIGQVLYEYRGGPAGLSQTARLVPVATSNDRAGGLQSDPRPDLR